MALPIERWAKQAVNLERKGDHLTPAADSRVLGDVGALAQLEMATWRQRERELRASGVPLMVEGLYAGLEALPTGGALPAVTSINGEIILWPAVPYTPINAASLMAPKAYRLLVMGLTTTSTSPANQTLTPRLGTSTSGATMGATAAVALTASITASFWVIKGDIVIRAIGAPGGTNASAYGVFHYMSTQATSGGLAGPAVVGAGHNLLFGGTAAAFDASIAQGFVVGVTHTVTTITHTPQIPIFASWN